MATVPSNHATIRAALVTARRTCQDSIGYHLQRQGSGSVLSTDAINDMERLDREVARIDAALQWLDTIAAGQESEPVPSGTYYTHHRDGFISYSPESRQLSVSQIKKRMTIFVGTLPEGWELRRAKQEPTNAK